MDNDGMVLGSAASSTDHQKTLCEELWTLRTEGAMCDVMLDVDGQHLLAHRLVLSACSPYLKMCCSEAESPTKSGLLTIKIQNCSYHVCLKTLEHLYTGRTVLISEPLLQEFTNLCQEWKLRHPLLSPNTCKSSPSEDANSGSGAFTNCVISPTLAKNSGTNNESECSSADVTDNSEFVSGICRPNTETDCELDSAKLETKTRLTPKKETFSKPNGNTRSMPKRSVSPRTSENPPKRQKSVVSPKKSPNHEPILKEETEKLDELPKRVRKQSDSDEIEPDDVAYDVTTSADDTPSSEDEVTIEPKPRRPQRQKTKRPVSPTKTVKLEKRPSKRRTRGRPRKKAASAPAIREYVKKSRKYVCRQCDLEFERRAELTLHRKEHHKENVFCNECQLQFPERNQLLAHNVEHHWQEGMELPEIYTCQVADCNFNTHKRMSWYNHRLHAHPSECSICDICGKSLKNELTLRQHKAVVHPTSPRKVFACPSCEKIFKTESGMQKHKDVAHRPWTSEREKFVCPYCAHTCMLAESLTEHLYKKHDMLPASRKSYKCKHCDFKTTHVAEIKKHEIRHKPDNEKPFECDKCEKRFVDRGSLVSHQLKHNISANIFRCQYCDYSTKYTHNLRAHVQVRHENKDYKPWECDECSYRCNSKGNLYKHLRNVHKRTVETKYTVARVGEPQVEQPPDPGRPPTIPPPPPLPPPPPPPAPIRHPEEADRGWPHLAPAEHVPNAPALWTLQCDHGEAHCTATSSQALSVPKPAPPAPRPPGPPHAPVEYEYVRAQRPAGPEEDPVASGHPHATTLPHPHAVPHPQQQVQLPQNTDINALFYPYPDF